MPRYPKGRCANIVRKGRLTICDHHPFYVVGCPDCIERRSDNAHRRWQSLTIDQQRAYRAKQVKRVAEFRQRKKANQTPLDEKVFGNHLELRQQLTV